MAETSVTQRVAAILAADVAGYSRLMADDEPATIAALDAARLVFTELTQANQGRIVDTAGDSVLAVFETTAGAVRAAVAIQAALAEANETITDARRMHFRIGIHLGDIHEKADGTIYGDGVNVAARLEAMARPGGITVSDMIHGAVRGRLDLSFEDLGEHTVKNIAEPVRAYRILGEDEAAAPAGARELRPAVVAGLVGALVVVVGLVAWQFMGSSILSSRDDPGLTVADGPSIAVLPFDNMSGDPEHEYFAAGLTEELITALSRFQDMKVIARHSTLGYKGAVDIRAVATDLGVRYVVEGSVRRGAENVRVTVQLLDGADGTHVWSETYDRPLTAANLFDIQDEVTAKIVGRVAGRYGVLNKDEVVASRAKPTDSLSAYECVLRSYAYLEVLTPEEHAATRACLERAVVSDPNYAEAWAWLGNRAAEEHALGFNPRPNAAERALEANRRAVALDAENQAVRYAMAWTLFFFGDLDAFVAEADLAFSLNPNNALILADLGNMLRYAGQRDRGMAMIQKAIELNPHHPGWFWLNIANDSFVHGDYRSAVKYVKQSKMPGYRSGLLTLAAAYGELGETDLAGEAIAKILEGSPDYTIEDFHERARRWRYPTQHTERYVAGLTKAGLPEAPPGPARPVIAVLPFDNMSGDAEQEYFADGITEDLITELQRRRVLVIARNSSFQYKGTAVDVREAGHELGASHVVEGSVRRAGDRVKITAQLLDAKTGKHLWAETYEEALLPSDIFAIQERITGRIATAIGHSRGAIAREAQERARRTPPESLAAYECVMIAQDFIESLDKALHATARDCLERTVESEPDYVQAWVALSTVIREEHMSRYNPRPDPLGRALAAAHEAVRLDPTNADAHAGLAVTSFFAHDLETFFAESEQVLALSPNDSKLLAEIGYFTAYAGKWERGVAMIEEAKVLDPLMPLERFFVIGHNHMRKGEVEEALAAYLRIDTLEHFGVWRSRAVAYAHLGRMEEARDAVAKMLAIYPDYQDDLWTYLRDWNFDDDFIRVTVEGLRKAGLAIPDEPAD